LAVAVLIPCHNEAATIRQVVEAFGAAIPHATVYVFDNCSTDATRSVAEQTRAQVRSESLPGKGNVGRRMFADVDADVYLLADGDGTYDAAAAPAMIRLLLDEHLDMVVGTRRDIYANAHRTGHGLGNRLFNRIYRQMFGPGFTDIFSGYRVFSRRFVKSFPAISSGFEIETEMSVHASELRMPVAEVPTDYGRRVEGSESKLRTVRDAVRILRTMILLFKEFRPARFFGVIAVLLVAGSLALGIPIVQHYIETGLVPRLPTAVLSTGLMILAAVALASGLILDSVARGRLELKRLLYLAQPKFFREPGASSGT